MTSNVTFCIVFLMQIVVSAHVVDALKRLVPLFPRSCQTTLEPQGLC
jgi:hypothetical protein